MNNKNDFTAKDFTVAAPEVCSLGRSAVDLISVSSQNKPANKKDEGDFTQSLSQYPYYTIILITYNFYNKTHLYNRPPLYSLINVMLCFVMCYSWVMDIVLTNKGQIFSQTFY